MKKLLSILVLFCFTATVVSFYYVQSKRIMDQEVTLTNSAEEEHQETFHKIDKIKYAKSDGHSYLNHVPVLNYSLSYNLFSNNFYSFQYISKLIIPPDQS